MSGTETEELPPSIRPLATVAMALGEWRESVVFIGGAIAPLLQSHPPFPRVRPTTDVDAIAAVASYGAGTKLETALTNLGFRRDLRSHGHADRWIAPGGVAFDLVPAGNFLGGSGNHWDQMAILTAERTVLANGVAIKHVSAPLFLVLKWAAYCDRGHGVMLTSPDMEDLLALLASRPALLDEIEAIPAEARRYLRTAARAIRSDPDFDDLLDAHLNNAVPRTLVVDRVSRTLRALAEETEP